MNRIRYGMSGKRCTCTYNMPSGRPHHPALKTVYERVGSTSKFVPIGLYCPKCKTFYDLEGNKK